MLSQYTWGQFALFALVLTAIYYLAVGLLYYRNELTALLRPGTKSAGLQPAAARVGEGPAPLVRTSSAFAPPVAVKVTPVAAEAEQPADGAADNLPEALAPAVSGTLPESTAMATGQDDSPEESGPMAAAAAVEGATDAEQELDERREEDLDEVNEELAAFIREAAQPTGAGAGETTAGDVPMAKLPAGEDALAPLEIDDSTSPSIEMNDAGEAAATEVAYQQSEAEEFDPFAAFNEPVASPLDLIPASPTRLVEADSLAAFLAQVQGGQQPAVPAELVGTTLAERMAGLNKANDLELAQRLGLSVEA